MSTQIALPSQRIPAEIEALATLIENQNGILTNQHLPEGSYIATKYTFPAATAAAASHTISIPGARVGMRAFATVEVVGTATNNARIGAIAVSAQDTVLVTWDASRDPSNCVLSIVLIQPWFPFGYVGISGNIAGGAPGTTEDILVPALLATDYFIGSCEGPGTNVDLSNITVLARQAADTARMTHASLDPVNADLVVGVFRPYGTRIIGAKLTFGATASSFVFTIPGITANSIVLLSTTVVGSAANQLNILSVLPGAGKITVTLSASLDTTSMTANFVAFNE